MKLLSYVLRELRNNRRFTFLFIFNLSMGLTGLIALDGFKSSIEASVEVRSQSMLGADFGISARRPIRNQEEAQVRESLGDPIEKTRLVEMYSMVAVPEGSSRLVQIKAIEGNYPFYGVIRLKDMETSPPLQGQPVTWIDSNLANQFEVGAGDSLRIGQATFLVGGVIDEDATAGLTSSMAPRVYMGYDQLEITGLVTRGTIAWHSVLYRLPGEDLDSLKEARDKIFAQIDQPDLKVFTHENVSAQMTTLVGRLNDFLGLASLVALFLAGVGSAFLFRSYFRGQAQQVAILLSLGLPRARAFNLYLAQVVILGLVSSLVAGALSLVVVNGLGLLTQGLLPFPIDLKLPWESIIQGFALGGVGSLFLCLPSLASLQQLRPVELLSMNNQNQGRLSWLVLLAVVPGLILFWVLSGVLANSFLTGSLFVLLFLGSTALLSFFSYLFFKALGKWSPRSVELRLSLRDMARNSLTSGVSFVAIGLGSLLLNLVPQVNTVLSAELERPDQSRIPSLFMFDIQEEQVEPLKTILRKENLNFDQVSPMVRARLMSVNGEAFDKGIGAAGDDLSREKEAEMRFRNRGFNLSYRPRMSSAERIVEGRAFSGAFVAEADQVPEISIEQRFAGRLGLKVGDRLVFDIESLPVEGRVVNLRSVQWTSFQPNFFVQFQPGVLEMAPKTYVATLPGVGADLKLMIQNKIVKEHPNVSMIDVSRVVESLNKIIEQMGWALIFMSVLCLLAGFIVIFSIANHQAEQRRWDVGLLKTLGASFKMIRRQFLWQFGIIASLAMFVGALMSLVLSYVFSSYLFESLWVFDWKVPAVSVVIGVVVSLTVTEWAIRSSLRIRINELFS